MNIRMELCNKERKKEISQQKKCVQELQRSLLKNACKLHLEIEKKVWKKGGWELIQTACKRNKA